MVVREQARQQLIARWIEPHPWKHSLAEARLAGSKIAVWAIVGQLRAAGRDAQTVAADYAIPLEAVEAALAYYDEHRAVIDDRLAANEPAPR
jgi:uncharacterized protein (DUF433 family)